MHAVCAIFWRTYKETSTGLQTVLSRETLAAAPCHAALCSDGVPTCTDEGDWDGVAGQQGDELRHRESHGLIHHAADMDAVAVPVQLGHCTMVAHIVQ